MRYPFLPKSTAHLKPGQFWAVPLSSGGFACGRVLQVGTSGMAPKSRVFFGGLHAWRGTNLPEGADIAGVPFLGFGTMHIKAITTTGGEVLGERSLETDKIELPLFLSAQEGPGTMILLGANPLREARKDEWRTLPVLNAWGYNFIQKLAEAKLEQKRA